ncbi:MAG TPA: hypothetical protein VFB62_09560 [Polyangiaceae bacterium]|nr:hypothetical protein [Polyangiaceae bacterium]
METPWWKRVNWTAVVLVLLPVGLTGMMLWIMLRQPDIPNPPFPTHEKIPELDGVLTNAECRASCIKPCTETANPDTMKACLDECQSKCRFVGKGTGPECRARCKLRCNRHPKTRAVCEQKCNADCPP